MYYNVLINVTTNMVLEQVLHANLIVLMMSFI